MPIKPLVAMLLGFWLAIGCADAQAPQPTPPQSPTLAPPDAERVAAAKDLMQLSGAAEQFDQIMPIMMARLSQSFEAVKPERAGEIRAVMNESIKRFLSRKTQLLDEIATIYARTMSLDDMKDIAAFYKTPAGVRFRQAMPTIAQQSMVAGQRWGSQIGSEIDREMRLELKKRGIDL